MLRSDLQMDAPSLVADSRCLLGEGPVWDADEGLLRWVDIEGRRVWAYDPRSERLSSAELSQPVGAIARTASGGFVGAARDGVGTLDPVSGELDVFAPFPVQGRRRANDAKCDRQGRLWVGVMHEEMTAGSGSLYCVDPAGGLRSVLEDLALPNGLDWSPDGSTMYFVDTLAHGVDAYAFDVATGALGPRTRLVDVPAADGLVDGLVVDAEGGIWVALCYGSAIRRYSPAGEHLDTCELPVTMPTSCAFGGADHRDLFITTATTGLSGEELRHQPGAGGVFRCRPGVAGIPATRYVD